MPSLAPTACLRCQGPMSPGFLVEHVGMPGTADVQLWVPGEPRRGLLAALKGPLVGYEVRTFRCECCGMLESYVPRSRS